MLRLQQASVFSRDPNTVRQNHYQKAELFVSLFVTDGSELVREMQASFNSNQRLIKPKRNRYLQFVASILILLIIILAGLLFVEIQSAIYACRMRKGSVLMNHETTVIHATRLHASETTERSEEYAAPRNSNNKISRRLQQNHESTLWAAKTALQNEVVQLSEKDSLNPKVYHNLTNFRKSFQVMERVFRIYVYKDGLKPLVHSGPKSGIYASEGLFIDSMERGNQFTVEDPMKATMFFMPFSLRHMVSYLYDQNTHRMQPIKTYIANYVDTLSIKHSFWNASGGSDHFFASCHDWALKATNSHGQLHKNAVKVVCNADFSQGFDRMKDVSLPETRVSNNSLTSILGGSPPDERPYLAFFAGQMHGSVRPILLQYWKDKDPLMRIFEVLPASIASKTSYSQHMKLSKYCLCPAGHEVNSPRLVEAIFSECVPVIIADNFVLPFSNVINWKSISVTVLQKDIPNLKNVLTSIPEQQYRAMQGRLKDVHQHFLWHDSPQKFDILTMIIHSLWTQRLNQLQLEDD